MCSCWWQWKSVSPGLSAIKSTSTSCYPRIDVLVAELTDCPISLLIGILVGKWQAGSRARGRHLRQWRVLLDQILRFEIRPELSGDLCLHGSVIRKDLLFAFAA